MRRRQARQRAFPQAGRSLCRRLNGHNAPREDRRGGAEALPPLPVPSLSGWGAVLWRRMWSVWVFRVRGGEGRVAGGFVLFFFGFFFGGEGENIVVQIDISPP